MDSLPGEIIPVDIEEVTSEALTAKEKKMSLAGLTRENSYRNLSELTKAEVMTLDKFGGEHLSADNPTRLRANEIILKMTGDISPEKVIDNRVINISGIDTCAVSQLLHMVKDVAGQLSALRKSGQQTGEIIDVTVT